MASSSSSLVPLMVTLSLALLLCISAADLQPDAIDEGGIAGSIASVERSLETVKSSKGTGTMIAECTKFLNDSVKNLNDAAAALKAGKTDDAKAKAYNALEDVLNCDDQFQSSGEVQVRDDLKAASDTIHKIIYG